MKIKLHHSFLALVLLTLCILHSALSTSFAQGTAFSYQGQLIDSGGPANGSYDFTFALFNENSTNISGQVDSTLTVLDVGVTNGLFNVVLDFGANFPGNPRWLALGVRTNASATFTGLNPLQEITPTPYAIFANTASNLSGTLPSTQLSGSLGNGQLANSSVTVTAGAGLSGGGAVALGGSTTLANAGVISVTGNSDITANTSSGAVTLSDTATSANVASTIVKRDDSGNFSAGTVTATNFTGNGGGLTNLNAAQLTSIGNASGGINNFFVGPAGNTTTSGSGNTAFGMSAFASNTSGSNNMACGWQALDANTTGSGNTAYGYEALQGLGGVSFITGGSNNIALGYLAGNNYVEGESGNIDIGHPGVMGENNNIHIGSNQTAAYIAGVINGDGGGLSNLDASQLISVGNSHHINAFNYFVGPAGNASTSGYNDTAIGQFALASNISGFNNLATGCSVLAANTTGADNTASGSFAMYQNITGSYNTADGYEALSSNTNGGYNTAGGFYALEDNVSGNGNTAEGGYALANLGENNFAGGTNNIALGYQAGVNFTANESSNICIGNVGKVGENNTIRIGTNQTACYLAGTVYASSFNSTSDRNAKENFQPVDDLAVLAKVASLPVTQWNFKKESKEVQHIGPMAQDFHAAFGLAGNDDTHISVVDEGGVALAAIQGLNQKLEQQSKVKDAKIATLEMEISELKSTARQASADWDARFKMLQKTVDHLADKSSPTLAANHKIEEAQ